MASIQGGLLQAFAAIYEHFGDAFCSGPFPPRGGSFVFQAW